jgi:hypothetical protein
MGANEKSRRAVQQTTVIVGDNVFLFALVIHPRRIASQHLAWSQPQPPLRHCPIVGNGCAGPPWPFMRID